MCPASRKVKEKCLPPLGTGKLLSIGRGWELFNSVLSAIPLTWLLWPVWVSSAESTRSVAIFLRSIRTRENGKLICLSKQCGGDIGLQHIASPPIQEERGGYLTVPCTPNGTKRAPEYVKRKNASGFTFSNESLSSPSPHPGKTIGAGRPSSRPRQPFISVRHAIPIFQFLLQRSLTHLPYFEDTSKPKQHNGQSPDLLYGGGTGDLFSKIAVQNACAQWPHTLLPDLQKLPMTLCTEHSKFLTLSEPSSIPPLPPLIRGWRESTKAD